MTPQPPEPEPADVRPPVLPPHWWRYGLVYSVAYTACVAATTVAGAAMYLGRVPNQLSVSALPWVCFAVIGAVPFAACHASPHLSKLWFERVILRRTPARCVAAVAAVNGSLVGGAFFGFAAMPSYAIKQLGLLVLVLGGPLLGLLVLVHWPRRTTDRDYDDEMSPEPPPEPVTAIDLPDLAATEAFGRRIGGLLFPNAVVALVGPLGAGKTHLTRAVAEGLGIANPAAVTSPTFTLVHEYPARLPIFHFDAYRLTGANEFLDLGVSEYYEAGGVCLVEWADKVEAALPAERLTIQLAPVDENRRRAVLEVVGERYEAMVRELASRPA